MENEQLKNESIASVKAILDYADAMYHSFSHKIHWETKDDTYLRKQQDYWTSIRKQCEQELELRIKQIFP